MKTTPQTVTDWGKHFKGMAESGTLTAENVEQVIGGKSAAVEKTVSITKRVAQSYEKATQSWAKLETAEQVHAGMWGAGAMLGAFGFLSAAKYSVAKDEGGKAHVQWSNVGVALLQAALAAGSAYIGAQVLKGGRA